ncbi:MAG: hypothetical protein ABIB79_03470 [archaeon]
MKKSHKNCIDFHKQMLESERHKFKCKKEFDLPRNGQLHRLDLACFRERPKFNSMGFVDSVGLEAETIMKNSPQILSNKKDLETFRKIFPASKTFHIQTDEIIDFDKELKPKFPQPFRPGVRFR